MATAMESINNPIILNKVREMLVNEMTANPDLYDECDLERVKSDNWTVKRFLAANKCDVETSFTMARDAMRWRKCFGVNHNTDEDFPIEFYQIGAIFSFAEDKAGRIVAYLRIKMHIPSKFFSEILQDYLMHLLNTIDLKAGEKGYTMVWDLNGAGPSNWHYATIKFLVHSSHSYFPGGIKCLLLCGVPWIMSPFVNIVLKFLPEETKQRIKNISKEQIFDYIDRKNVPDFLGGECDIDYRKVPKGARPAKDFVDNPKAKERGITIKDIDEVLKSYDKYLKEVK